MESSQVAWVEPLRQALSRLGRELQICVHPRAFAQKGIRILEKWIRETPASGWIVLYSTEAMQAWFHQQNLPVIIAGSSFREDRLHSIDLDFRALGRHAAGMLLARGYSRIGLLTRSDPRAGDQLTEQGFQEALATHPESTVESLVIRYDGTPTGFARALDRFSQRASLPSAYLTVDFSTLLSLLTYLMSKNQIMGRDYSVISRDESTFIHSLIPSVAYYRRDQERYGKALLRMLLRVIREPRLRPQSVKMMPSFQTGASILANAKRSPRF